MLAATEYRVQLDLYQGPMDLMLYLVRRHEIDLLRVRIAQITAQFLNNPYLVPQAFTLAGHLSAGRRTQLAFLGSDALALSPGFSDRGGIDVVRLGPTGPSVRPDPESEGPSGPD